MTTKVQLNAQTKEEAKGKAKRVRAAGFIPAVVYGSGKENQNIKVKKHDFEKAFAVTGEFSLIDLSIDGGEASKVIIKDVQHNSLTNNIIHIDFYRVDMAKKISIEIPLNFIGEPKVFKEKGGTLVKNMSAVEASCLPGDLVSYINVDISGLDDFDQFIRLRDLILPPGIELASATNEAVAGVVETEVEKEEVRPAEAVPAEGQAEAGAKPAEAEQTAEAKK